MDQGAAFSVRHLELLNVLLLLGGEVVALIFFAGLVIVNSTDLGVSGNEGIFSVLSIHFLGTKSLGGLLV